MLRFVDGCMRHGNTFQSVVLVLLLFDEHFCIQNELRTIGRRQTVGPIGGIDKRGIVAVSKLLIIVQSCLSYGFRGVVENVFATKKRQQNTPEYYDFLHHSKTHEACVHLIIYVVCHFPPSGTGITSAV